jgi:hypothetical protein
VAAAGVERMIPVTPDAESVAALGTDLYDRAAWRPAFLAGARQGQADEELRAAWNA